MTDEASKRMRVITMIGPGPQQSPLSMEGLGLSESGVCFAGSEVLVRCTRSVKGWRFAGTGSTCSSSAGFGLGSSVLSKAICLLCSGHEDVLLLGFLQELG